MVSTSPLLRNALGEGRASLVHYTMISVLDGLGFGFSVVKVEPNHPPSFAAMWGHQAQGGKHQKSARRARKAMGIRGYLFLSLPLISTIVCGCFVISLIPFAIFTHSGGRAS